VSRGGDGTYRVVEVSPVAEDTLEAALNEGVATGWGFESIHFVTREGSHRPALAYLFLVRRAPARKRMRP
jgi:hypothetical protein